MRWAQCGDLHAIFTGGEVYLPPAARENFNHEAYEELANLGLIQGNVLTEEFEHTLQVLGKPDIEYFAFTRSQDETHDVLTAISGKFAVLARRYGHRVWIEPVWLENPAESLIRALPEFPAAHFTSFSLAQSEWRALHAAPDPYRADPVPTRMARKLQEIFQQPCHGVAEIGCVRIKSTVDNSRSQDSLVYLDTESGRVGIHISSGKDSKYLTVFPGEPGQLLSRMTGSH